MSYCCMITICGCARATIHSTSQSLPPRGAWIEINTNFIKHIYIIVAPPAGSVD